MSDHVHRFDPDSGWCSGCTVRNDGRQTWYGDVVRPGREYTPAELAEIRERANHARA